MRLFVENESLKNTAEPILRRLSGEGVFGGIGDKTRTVVRDVFDPEIAEDVEQRLSAVGEGDGSVVGIALLDQHMAVKASHFRYCEYAYAAE